MRLKILQYDHSIVLKHKQDGTLEDYLDKNSAYSIVPFKSKQKPSNGWAMPYVTGHRYRLHWEAGLDFEHMAVEMSEKWTENDKNIQLVFNFTEAREAVNITNR